MPQFLVTLFESIDQDEYERPSQVHMLNANLQESVGELLDR